MERTTRSVSLTAIGDAFLPRARRLLLELSDALTEIRETGKAQRGDVAVACVPTAGIQYLPEIIREYSARHGILRTESRYWTTHPLVLLKPCCAAKQSLALISPQPVMRS